MRIERIGDDYKKFFTHYTHSKRKPPKPIIFQVPKSLIPVENKPSINKVVMEKVESSVPT